MNGKIATKKGEQNGSKTKLQMIPQNHNQPPIMTHHQ
jgi:hypothetical protein